MGQTMLDVLKARIENVDGLGIKSVKETNSKYVILFEHQGEEVKMDLPKSCAPGFQNDVVDQSIALAMSAICFKLGDYTKSREWIENRH